MSAVPPSLPPRVPPRFVPTLTEVVEQPAGGEGSTFQARWADLEEPLVQRILQRVDVALERRVREVLAQVVREQTQAMLPKLRDEIEAVVRQAINDAVAQELDTK